MEGKWVWVGAAASVGMGLLAYVLSEDNRKPGKSPSLLSRLTLLEILKGLHGSATSVLIEMTGHSEGMDRDSGNGEVDVRRLRQGFEEVYRRYGVREEDVRKAYEKHRDDPEVAELACILFTNHHRAQQGLPLLSSGSTSLSPHSVLWLLRTFHRISAGRSLSQLSLLEAEGVRLSPFDARFQKAVEELIAEQNRLKERLYQQVGLRKEEGDQQVKRAVEIFAADAGFLKEYNEVEEEYNSTMHLMCLQRLSPASKARVLVQMQQAMSQLTP